MTINKTNNNKSPKSIESKAKAALVKKSPLKKVTVSVKKKSEKTSDSVKENSVKSKNVKTVIKVAPIKKNSKVNKTEKLAVVKLPAKLSAKNSKTKASAIKKEKSKFEKDTIQQLVDAAVEGILEVKGRNITILNLEKINNRVCDYYIICQADSSTQVNAIAGSVETIVKKKVSERPYHTEGFQNSEWILVDYVTVVVHVFQSHIRDYFNLEGLWADAEVTKIAFD